jgi:L-seryl-tRNA(Ser) seleniumtransferase
VTQPRETRSEGLRQLPAIHALLETEDAARLLTAFPRAVVRNALRASLEQAREQMREEGANVPTAETLLDNAARWLASRDLRGLQRVINATGIVLHTNLGRAPLADAAVEAVRQVASGYSNLEMDLATGKRGGRGGEIGPLLCALTGAESALAVNNNAAGVLLALTALAAGGEVIVSRGELVEIGGAFRVPDVIRQSGARLVEVGTTNKTRISDYAAAITSETKVLLKVHPSNYRIVGFTAEASLAELAQLAAAHSLIVVEDLGSGALIDLIRYGLPHEPTCAEALRAGADVVAASGDKLLGGPQCGLLLGKAALISRMAAHPLQRALRADKMTLAALEATLRLYEDPDRLVHTLPVLRMLAQTPAELLARARRLRRGLAALPGLTVSIVEGVSYSGGGTLPEERLPSRHVRVQAEGLTPSKLAERLRHGHPPIIGMVSGDAFVMDVRTLTDGETRCRQTRRPSDRA